MADTQDKRPRVIACPDCSRPAARVVNGVLLIQSRHGGKTHTTPITLEKLEELLKATR